MIIKNILNFPESKEMTKIAYKKPCNIILHDDVIAMCRANVCGNYNKNWTCPPNRGEINKLQQEISKFNQYIVVQNIFPLEDSFDFEGMVEAEKIHDKRVRTLANRIKLEYSDINFLALGCGGCKACKKCAFPNPCITPEKAMASVEGMGINVPELVEEVGLEYINGVNTVSYVGLLLW